MITYSQNFEDVFLERLFQEKRLGFYVDVGAWDPDRHSVTKHFYKRGWRGVNVEPIAGRLTAFEQRRPRDINIRSLVGVTAGTKRFFECVDDDALSTTMVDVADRLRKSGKQVVDYEVPVERLDTIFERHCPKVVDFLKVDVEGAEAEVLKSIDLRRRPARALVIESTRPGSGLKSWDKPDAYGTWQEWEEDVLAAGYLFALFDGLNRFYVRREDSRLVRRLSLPPGILDGIDASQSSQVEAAERLDVIERQEIAIRQAEARAEATLEVGRDQINRLTGERSQLVSALEASEAESAARLTTISRLDRDARELMELLDRSEATSAERLRLIERMSADLDGCAGNLRDLQTTHQAEITILNADREARGGVIHVLHDQLEKLKLDHAARVAIIDQLESDRRAQLETINRLSEELRASQAGAQGEYAARCELVAELDIVREAAVARKDALDALTEHLASVELDSKTRLKLLLELDEAARRYKDELSAEREAYAILAEQFESSRPTVAEQQTASITCAPTDRQD